MVSRNKNVQYLLEVLALHAVKHIVFSPGSRNAPLVISFSQDKRFECYSIVDERSAGFFALGIAQQSRQPVVLCCTSGSAALNYASAISEAFYQKIPLLVITTDRPPEWINHGEGQAIIQTDVFNNFVCNSYNLPVGETENDLWLTERSVNQSVIDAIAFQQPVHLNMPFREPLYQTAEKITIEAKKIDILPHKNILTEVTFNSILTKIKSSKKVLILCGSMPKNERLNYALGQMAENSNAVVLTESTSNLYHRLFIPCIDRVITTFEKEEKNQFAPDLLITIGNSIISKKIKHFLRQEKGIEHWHIEDSHQIIDTYQKLNFHIKVSPDYFFGELIKKDFSVPYESYKNLWQQRHQLTLHNHHSFLRQVTWSDLKVFDILYNTFPVGINLQMGNSSVVRYLQLFNTIKGINYNSNRGVSGIDGCTSTAVGACYNNNKMTVLVTGDLSFVYDSNAFWNRYLSPNLRVIVINNDGGGIFSIIQGPSSTPAHRDFFEVGNQADIKHLANMHNLNYYRAENELQLEEQLSYFYQPQENKRPAILEIFTPPKENSNILKQYFSALKSF